MLSTVRSSVATHEQELGESSIEPLEMSNQLFTRTSLERANHDGGRHGRMRYAVVYHSVDIAYRIRHYLTSPFGVPDRQLVLCIYERRQAAMIRRA